MPLTPGLSPAIRQLAPEAPELPEPTDIVVEMAEEGGDQPQIDEAGNILKIEHGDGSITVSLDGLPIERAEGKGPDVVVGAKRRGIVSFVLPAGYTFNLDGSTLYLAMASVFVAQAAETTSGVHIGIGQQLMMMLTLMLTTKGIAAVPRASLVILSGTLASFGLPLEGVAIILGVDELMDMARTAVNVMGNCLATAVVARWEGEFIDNYVAPEPVLDLAEHRMSESYEIPSLLRAGDPARRHLRVPPLHPPRTHRRHRPHRPLRRRRQHRDRQPRGRVPTTSPPQNPRRMALPRPRTLRRTTRHLPLDQPPRPALPPHPHRHRPHPQHRPHGRHRRRPHPHHDSLNPHPGSGPSCCPATDQSPLEC